MKILTGVIKQLIFALTMLTLSSGAYANDVLEPKFDRAVSEQFLQVRARPTGTASLTVGSYDTRQGLLALYETANGKRVLFRSKVGPSGRIIAQALHKNARTNRIEQLMGPAFNPVSKISLFIGDTDLMDTLNEGRKNKRFNVLKQTRLKAFIRDESGEALLDGIAALYVQLDRVEPNNEVAKLKVPFGLVRTTLELITGQYNGIDKLVGNGQSRKLDLLRANCTNSDCLYRSHQFMVQRSGLFDVVSELKSRSAQANAAICNTPATAAFGPRVQASSISIMSGVVDSINTDPDNPCFGQCGPGCFTPGSFVTTECQGHDRCVRDFGHMDCMFSTPSGCNSCYSLIDAIGSFFDALYEFLFP